MSPPPLRPLLTRRLPHLRRTTSTHRAPAPPPRTARILAKLPARLQPYAARFADAPASHVTAFLVLHELTAVVPAAGVFAVLHATQWSPPGLPGEWVREGVEKWGNYTRKKGWEMFRGEKGARLVLELATAWAVVKVLMPVRLAACVWLTPRAVRAWAGVWRRVRRMGWGRM